MKFNLWLPLLIALVIVMSTVSIAAGNEELITGTGGEHFAGTGTISPIAAGPHVKTVIYYVNGVKQPALDFTEVSNYHVDIFKGDTITFKVICSYTGSGKGYMIFRDMDSGYQESMFLKSGVVSVKNVMRSFMWVVTGSYLMEIDGYTNGNNWYDPPGDYNYIIVHVN
jgi:hypothetical protein